MSVSATVHLPEHVVVTLFAEAFMRRILRDNGDFAGRTSGRESLQDAIYQAARCRGELHRYLNEMLDGYVEGINPAHTLEIP